MSEKAEIAKMPILVANSILKVFLPFDGVHLNIVLIERAAKNSVQRFKPLMINDVTGVTAV